MRGGLLGWYVLLAGGLGALGWLAAGAQGGAPEGAQRVPVGPPGAAASMPLLPLEDADAVEVGGGERGNASLLPDGTYSPFDPTLRRYWQERAKRLAARKLLRRERDIAQAQNRRCEVCGDWLGNGETLETTFGVWAKRAGADSRLATWAR